PLNLDEFIDEIEFGLFHFIIVVASGLCYSTVSLLTQAAGLVIIAACDLDTDNHNQIWWVLSNIIGTLIGSAILGRLSDAIGRRKILLLSTCLNLIVTILSAFAYNYILVLIFAIFNGIGFGGIFTSVHAYCLEFFPRKYRGKAIGCLTACIIFGSVYSSGMGYIILPHRFHAPLGKIYFSSWRLYLLVCTLPIIISFLLLLWAPDSLRFRIKRGEMEKVIRIINKIYRTNSYCHRDGHLYRLVTPPDLNKSQRKDNHDDKNIQLANEYSFKCHFSQIIQRQTLLKIIALSVTWFGYCFCFYGLWTMLPLLISFYLNGNTCSGHYHNFTTLFNNQENPGHSVCLNSQNRATLLIYVLFGNLLSIPVALICVLSINFIGRKWLFSFLAFLSSIIILLIWLIDTALSTLILACFFAGVLINGWIPLKLLSSESFPTEFRSTTLGIFTIFGGIGSLCGIFSFSSLFKTNCSASFILLIVNCLVSGLMPIIFRDT
ncbi:uncharacterized protein TRIADDRAFT_2343, partial [Trichoplax adhaerens]